MTASLSVSKGFRKAEIDRVTMKRVQESFWTLGCQERYHAKLKIRYLSQSQWCSVPEKKESAE